MFFFTLAQMQFGTLEQLREARHWENRVYLATYPRSGNHWMRHLIEEATGIVTSSAYRDADPRHLKSPFSWGGYCCDHGYTPSSSKAPKRIDSKPRGWITANGGSIELIQPPLAVIQPRALSIQSSWVPLIWKEYMREEPNTR